MREPPAYQRLNLTDHHSRISGWKDDCYEHNGRERQQCQSVKNTFHLRSLSYLFYEEPSGLDGARSV